VSTAPETTVCAPVSPEVERYTTRAARIPWPVKVLVTPGMVVADSRVPGPEPARSAEPIGSGAPDSGMNMSRVLEAAIRASGRR